MFSDTGPLPAVRIFLYQAFNTYFVSDSSRTLRKLYVTASTVNS